MRLVYKFKYDSKHADRLLKLCEVSKNLYNQSLYAVKHELKENNRFLFYNDLEKLMKSTPNLEGEINYRLLKAQVSQQCLKLLDKNVKSYIKSIKDWSKHKDKYKGKPRLPKYKEKYNLLVFTNQCSSLKDDGNLYLYKDLVIRIPQWERYGDSLSKGYQQTRVIPSSDNSLTIEIIYEKQIYNTNVDSDRYASIDLGVDNVASVVYDDKEAILYNGKQIKSINQFANKLIARYKSELETKNRRKSSKRIRSIYTKRNARMEDYFHKLSRAIVSKAVANNIGTIVVGYNKGWKDSIDIGKRNNQTFVMIPFESLVSKLKYKCEMCGLRFALKEESYTSKCDALALEQIGKHDTYLGKRVKRGLFQSSTGKLINADINGALNILRKVLGDSDGTIQRIADSGRLFRPLKHNVL